MPGSIKSLILGDKLIPPLIGNPYNRYTKPLRNEVDEFIPTIGKRGSLDPSRSHICYNCFKPQNFQSQFTHSMSKFIRHSDHHRLHQFFSSKKKSPPLKKKPLPLSPRRKQKKHKKTPSKLNQPTPFLTPKKNRKQKSLSHLCCFIAATPIEVLLRIHELNPPMGGI